MEPDTPRPRRAKGGLPRVVALPLLAAVTVGLVYVATRPLGGGPQPSFFVIGSAAPGVQIGQLAPGTATAPAAPQLALKDLDGRPIELRQFADRPVWIIFWKTACEPCEAEAADVAAAYAGHRAEGLTILGVDVWDTSAVVKDYVAGHALDYPIAIAQTSAFMDAYGVWGAPTHYFLDPSGIIRDRYFGPMTRDLIDESLDKII
jgi:peroxiredoxin